MKEIGEVLDEMEKLEKQYSLVKEKFEKLIEQASDGVVIIQGGIIIYKPKFCRVSWLHN